VLLRKPNSWHTRLEFRNMMRLQHHVTLYVLRIGFGDPILLGHVDALMVPLLDTVAIRGSNAGCTRTPSFVDVDFLARDKTPSSSSRANEHADLLLLGPSEREFCVRYNRESEFRAGGF
jgi:hypothetical protein